MKTLKFSTASEISSASSTTLFPSPDDQATFDTVTALKNFLTSIRNLPFQQLSNTRDDLKVAIGFYEVLLKALGIKIF